MRAIVHRYAGLHLGPRGRVRFKNAFTPPGTGGAQAALINSQGSQASVLQQMMDRTQSLAGTSPPTPLPPPLMPDPNSPDALEARRKAMAAASQGGRNSTMLTSTAQRAGGTLAGGATSLGASA